jgi:hypothetical protein
MISADPLGRLPQGYYYKPRVDWNRVAGDAKGRAV